MNEELNCCFTPSVVDTLFAQGSNILGTRIICYRSIAQTVYGSTISKCR